MNVIQSCGLILFVAFCGVDFSEGLVGSSPRKHVTPLDRIAGKPAQSMVDFVIPNGYPLEEYDVVTEDGYILGIYRIPHGRNYSSAIRPPIVLRHGLFASSTCFVMGVPEKALAFILADAGFDVWLTNARGNLYSKRHTKLDPVKDAKEYYDFSFHEMGCYDLPAVIDFVLNVTKQSQVSYIGHSQGTTEFFAMASTRPEYNAKIKVAANLAPVGFMSDVRGAFKFLSHVDGLLDVANKFGIYMVFKIWPFPRANTFPESLILPPIASHVLYSIGGYDTVQFNESIVPSVLQQGSSGGTVKQLKHYSQIIKSGGKFSLYDYGEDENMKRYNQTTPPEYDLSKITARISLHYSSNDYVSRIPDVEKLHSQLPQSTLIKVPFEKFNHIDFLWAYNVTELLYDDLIKLLKIYD